VKVILAYTWNSFIIEEMEWRFIAIENHQLIMAGYENHLQMMYHLAKAYHKPYDCLHYNSVVIQFPLVS